MGGDASARRYRVAVVNTHPIQYFAPLYAYLHAHCPQIELTVFYLTDYSLRDAVDPGFAERVVWDIDLLGGYQSEFVGEHYRTAVPESFWALRDSDIYRRIRDGRFDLVWLHGYNHWSLLLALIAARRSGALTALRADTQLLLHAPGWRRGLRNLVLGRLLRYFDRLFAVGERNRDYYRYLGVPPQRIVDMPYAVDNARFGCAGRSHRKPRVLYASKLIERKDPRTLIQAAALLQGAGIDAEYIIAGSGPLESVLRAEVKGLGLQGVEFRGFVNQAQMPALLAEADVFVLCSRWEPWGLIVNEAMAAGLPVVVSHEVGCSVDLVEPGVNGYRVRAGDPAALAYALKRLIEAPDRMRAMGADSARKIASYGFDACAAGLLEALTLDSSQRERHG